MSARGGTKRDLLKTIEGLQSEVTKWVDLEAEKNRKLGACMVAATLLREVERRARFVAMMRENGLKHEPAWDELVKALNALREYDTANKTLTEKEPNERD